MTGFSQSLLAAVALAAGVGSAQAEERPGLGRHDHGVTTLALAIEGAALQIAVEAPAADLAGVEYAPTTDRERAALEAAIAALGDPLALFALPAEAGCSVAEAAVAQVFEDKPPMPAGPMDEHARRDGETEAVHSEFHASYRLECADVAAVTAIELPYFALFPRVRAVAVTVATGKGETAFEVLRAEPRLSLEALM